MDGRGLGVGNVEGATHEKLNVAVEEGVCDDSIDGASVMLGICVGVTLALAVGLSE